MIFKGHLQQNISKLTISSKTMNISKIKIIHWSKIVIGHILLAKIP